MQNQGSTFWFTSLIPVCSMKNSSRRNLLDHQHVTSKHGMPQRIKGITPRLKSLSILVVDDNFVSQLVMKKMLSSFGCKVTIAKDGLTALSVFQAQLHCSQEISPRQDVHPMQYSHFDIIFTDIQMPGLTGYMTIPKHFIIHHPQVRTKSLSFKINSDCRWPRE